VPDEVDDDDKDDFANFDDDEDALDPADEQRAMMALFETARIYRAVHQFMVVDHQANQEVRDMWHHAHQVAASPARTWTSWPG
jgi:hypothetical protein